MNADQLTYALLAVSLIAGVLAAFSGRETNREEKQQQPGMAGPITGYLLAGGSLGRLSVLNLLVSSSFGLNSLFYAAWLGYAIGAYALIVQVSWTLSFVFLSKYAHTVRNHRSMHHLLGHDFGAATRVIAGACSLAGMMYFIGWESEIARQTFAGLLSPGTATPAPGAIHAASLLTSGTIIACLLYTVLGGLKGNAWADQALNWVKLLAVGAVIAVLAVIAYRSAAFHVTAALFPPWSALMANLGIFGFITNVAFNLAWQFVDASSWQSIISGRQATPDDARLNVLSSGVAIFIVPNLIGTILGILLHGAVNVTSDNIVGRAALISADFLPVVGIAAAVMIVACVMSLLDGMFLACAFTFVVDILFPRHTLDELEHEPVRAESILLGVRLGLIAIAVASAWGVHALMQVFHVSVFDLVYIMIITQLGLFGPNLAALRGRSPRNRMMWTAILFSVAVGGFAAWRGTHGGSHYWIDAAGTITTGLSLIVAFALTSSSRPANQPEAAQ